MKPHVIIYQCNNNKCLFRFHERQPSVKKLFCPKCGSEMNGKTVPDETSFCLNSSTNNGKHIEVLLDNVRSLYNVGSIFRTSDGAGINKLYLSGITPTPDNPKLLKTSLGAEETIDWEYSLNAFKTVLDKKEDGYQIISLECCNKSLDLFSFSGNLENKILLVAGSEKEGVDPEILSYSDIIFSIPMNGMKNSLNIASAYSIIIYQFLYGIS